MIRVLAILPGFAIVATDDLRRVVDRKTGATVAELVDVQAARAIVNYQATGARKAVSYETLRKRSSN